ncbi:MAG TPA: pseudouridine synthase [Rhodospirillaceae bacterium]|nr:pseudouridine synthase [Rhodospirillaceae bacterium]
MSERIAKYLSRVGVASRRSIETMITEGRIAVNGKVIDHPATFVSEADEIKVDGEVLGKKEPARMWLYHKPKNAMVAERDPEGRTTIYDLLPPELPRVMPVGRLDYATEGLLLLTNSGALKRHLELPATGWLRKYKTRCRGEWRDEIIDELEKGITVDGEKFGPIHVTWLENRKGGMRHTWLEVSLREGKNREVRRALAHFGLEVDRLIRVAYGSFNLSNMQENEIKEVPAKILREQIGTIWSDL